MQEIRYTDSNGHFRLNTDEWSAYSNEKEVLLQDGKRFTVLDVIENYQITDANN